MTELRKIQLGWIAEDLLSLIVAFNAKVASPKIDPFSSPEPTPNRHDSGSNPTQPNSETEPNQGKLLGWYSFPCPHDGPSILVWDGPNECNYHCRDCDALL